MKKNYNTLNELFNSAREYKSPVTQEDVRSLIEKRDIITIKNDQLTSKKGIKTMWIISALIISLIFGSVGFNLVDSINPSMKNESNVNFKSYSFEQKQNYSNQESIALSKKNSADLDNLTNNTTNVKKNKNLGLKVQGLNRIILTEKELLKIGIYLGEGSYRDRANVPFIGYIEPLSEVSVMKNEFYKEWGSSHRTLNFPLEENLKVIEISPEIITDYYGTVRLSSRLKDDDISEFLPFHKELGDFIGFDFNAKFPLESLPKSFDPKIVKLSEYISIYLNNDNSNEDLCSKIRNELSELNKTVSSCVANYMKTIEIPDTDTIKYSSSMVYFDENPEDTIHNEFIESMAKLGVKIKFERQPIKMYDVLKVRDSKLADALSDMQSKVQNHIMLSKLIAVEIPYINDPDNEGLIFWYAPSEEVLNALPDRISNNLRMEIKEFQKKTATCGSPIKSEQTYMDIWRACDGAIENLRLFPNPVQNDINIKFDLKESRTLRISIHDLTGTELMVIGENQFYSMGENTTKQNVSSLKPGMYLLVVSSSNGEKAMQRIIKK